MGEEGALPETQLLLLQRVQNLIEAVLLQDSFLAEISSTSWPHPKSTEKHWLLKPGMLGAAGPGT